MARFFVVGSVNPEFVVSFEQTGETKVRAHRYTDALGGTAYNVARHLVGLRGATEVLSQFLVGSDMLGSVVHERLSSIGGEPLWWRPQTAVAFILLPTNARHQTIGVKDKSAVCTPDRRAKLRETIARQNPQVIFVAGLLAGERWIAEELFCRSEGALRVFTPDVSACKNGSFSLALDVADFLIMNEEEARALFGVTDVVAEAEKIYTITHAGGSASVVITRAERGAVMIGYTIEPIEVSVPQIVSVKQPVGAGDAFIASFLANLRPNITPRELLTAAVAAGTRHVAGETLAVS